MNQQNEAKEKHKMMYKIILDDVFSAVSRI